MVSVPVLALLAGSLVHAGETDATALADPAEQPPEVHRCTLDVGDGTAATVQMDLPPGFSGQGGKSCAVWQGPSMQENTLLVQVLVISDDDAGPEQHLGIAPDGARRWIQAIAPEAVEVGLGSLTLLGGAQPYYRFHKVPMAGPDREVLLARAQVPGQQIVVMAIYPTPSTDAAPPTVLPLLHSVSVTAP